MFIFGDFPLIAWCPSKCAFCAASNDRELFEIQRSLWWLRLPKLLFSLVGVVRNENYERSLFQISKLQFQESPSRDEPEPERESDWEKVPSPKGLVGLAAPDLARRRGRGGLFSYYDSILDSIVHFFLFFFAHFLQRFAIIYTGWLEWNPRSWLLWCSALIVQNHKIFHCSLSDFILYCRSTATMRSSRCTSTRRTSAPPRSRLGVFFFLLLLSRSYCHFPLFHLDECTKSVLWHSLIGNCTNEMQSMSKPISGQRDKRYGSPQSSKITPFRSKWSVVSLTFTRSTRRWPDRSATWREATTELIRYAYTFMKMGILYLLHSYWYVGVGLLILDYRSEILKQPGREPTREPKIRSQSERVHSLPSSCWRTPRTQRFSHFSPSLHSAWSFALMRSERQWKCERVVSTLDVIPALAMLTRLMWTREYRALNLLNLPYDRLTRCQSYLDGNPRAPSTENIIDRYPQILSYLKNSFQLPDDVNEASVKSWLSPRGYLVITAHKKTHVSKPPRLILWLHTIVAPVGSPSSTSSLLDQSSCYLFQFSAFWSISNPPRLMLLVIVPVVQLIPAKIAQYCSIFSTPF